MIYYYFSLLIRPDFISHLLSKILAIIENKVMVIIMCIQSFFYHFNCSFEY